MSQRRPPTGSSGRWARRIRSATLTRPGFGSSWRSASLAFPPSTTSSSLTRPRRPRRSPDHRVARQDGRGRVNLDVERLSNASFPAYGAFIGRLRKAVVARIPAGRVTVATNGAGSGALMAATAIANGADRAFLMGYSYRSSGSARSARNRRWSSRMAIGTSPRRSPSTSAAACRSIGSSSACRTTASPGRPSTPRSTRRADRTSERRAPMQLEPWLPNVPCP